MGNADVVPLASRRGGLGVAAAAADGGRRDLLVAMRERIAKAVDDLETPPRDLASLTRRLLEIAKEIESIDVEAADEAEEASGGEADDSFDPSSI